MVLFYVFFLICFCFMYFAFFYFYFLFFLGDSYGSVLCIFFSNMVLFYVFAFFFFYSYGFVLCTVFAFSVHSYRGSGNHGQENGHNNDYYSHKPKTSAASNRNSGKTWRQGQTGDDDDNRRYHGGKCKYSNYPKRTLLMNVYILFTGIFPDSPLLPTAIGWLLP